MSKNRIIAVVLIAVAFFGLFMAAKVRGVKKNVPTTEQIQRENGIPVQLASVQLGRIEDTIPITGDIKALQTVTLSSKVPGKVGAIFVREGDAVRRGQVVAQLDRSDYLAQLRQAEAGLQSAQARLSQAQTGYNVTTVQSSAAIEQAKAGLAAAQANYEKIKNGARSQERMIAENQVATAKANLDNAQANLKRYKQLYQQGAVAQAQLDVYQTQYDVAQAQYNSAKQNMSLVEEGARSEDVRAAQTQVTQAKEALKTAQANAGQNAIRQEDIKNARAGVAQAEAQVALAKEQLDNTNIISPIDGIVSNRMAEPGQMALTSVPLIEVVDLSTVYFQAGVSETVLSKIHPGQVVMVSVDAYPSAGFTGTVQKIYPTASANTREFSVRVHIPNPKHELRPGMFARGSVITGSSSGAMLVSQDAIENRNGRDVVFVENDKTVTMVPVTKGMSNENYVEILSPTDLKPGDMVVTSGHENLQDGSKVYVPSTTERRAEARP